MTRSSIFRYSIRLTSTETDLDLSPFIVSFDVLKRVTQDDTSRMAVILRPEINVESDNLIFKEVRLKLVQIDGNNKTTLYDSTCVVTQYEITKGGGIRIELESKNKIRWGNRTYFSKEYSHQSVADALKDYVNAINNHIGASAELFFSTTSDLNDFKYEKIMIKGGTSFKAVERASTMYKVYNAPFYVFLDDFHLSNVTNSASVTRIGLYNLSNPMSLRASYIEGGTSLNPIKIDVQNASYMSESINREVFQTQYKFKEPLKYVKKSFDIPSDKDLAYELKYTPDTESNAKTRIENAKKWYKMNNQYATFRIDELDVASVEVGTRLFVHDKPSTQYTYICLETHYSFTPVSGYKDESLSLFKCSAEIVCLKFMKERTS